MSTRKILRLRQVMELTGFKRTKIYQMMKQSRFPKSRAIGLRAVGWDSVEVAEWISLMLDGEAK